MGSQAGQGGNRDGPELPGLENLGIDAVVAGEFLFCIDELWLSIKSDDCL